MIRNEREYQEAIARLSEEHLRLDEHRIRLESEGLDKAGITRVLQPIQSFHLQLREEVDSYERLKQGNLGGVHNLHGLGRALVGLRIARGISQKDLAQCLGVHESQVSRDERNEYHGITVYRATRILDALGAEFESTFKKPVLPFSKRKRASLLSSKRPATKL